MISSAARALIRSLYIIESIILSLSLLPANKANCLTASLTLDVVVNYHLMHDGVDMKYDLYYQCLHLISQRFCHINELQGQQCPGGLAPVNNYFVNMMINRGRDAHHSRGPGCYHRGETGRDLSNLEWTGRGRGNN